MPRKGHCLRAKLNLNETKRGWCRGCSMAEPTTEGGGEYWQPSNERMPCQKGGMIPHNKVWWHSLLPDALCSVRAVWATCSHIYRKVHCSISRLCPYVGQVVMFWMSLRFQLNLIICDASCLINTGQQDFICIWQADPVCHIFTVSNCLDIFLLECNFQMYCHFNGASNNWAILHIFSQKALANWFQRGNSDQSEF